MRHLPELDHPDLSQLVVDVEVVDAARRAHPVQRLVTAAVGVDQQAAVAFVHQDSRGKREVCVEASGVVDGAASYDEAHPSSVLTIRD